MTSDSDFWGLIRSLPDARFLVMMQKDKAGTTIKEQLEKNSIIYCFIDDFYSSDASDLKTKAILKIMRQKLQEHEFNVNEILDAALQSTRTQMSKAEYSQFVNTYIRPMHITMTENGDVRFNLKNK